MKALLCIIAIVAIGAAAWFSFERKNKFQELRTARLELDAQNETRNKNIKKERQKIEALEIELDTASKALADAESKRDNTKENLKLAKKQSAEWSGKVAGQKEKLEGIQSLITEVKQAFEGVADNVDLDEIPSLIQKLEEDVAGVNKNLAELESNVRAAKIRVATGEEQIKDLDQRVAKRANRLKSNALEGRITAVNHDWGFVTVQIPKNMPVTEASKLMIKRGSGYIGNLKINAIEGTRIIADIDYKNMSSGMVVQPGDAVVLTKPVTN